MRGIIKIPSKHFTDLVEVSFLNYPLPAFMFLDVPSDVCLHSFLYSVTDSIINTLLMFMHRLGREFDKPAFSINAALIQCNVRLATYLSNLFH